MFYLLIGLIAGPAVAVIATALGTFFVHLLFNVLLTSEGEKVHKLDQILKRTKVIGPKGPSGKIADGWHRGWYKGSLIIAHKGVQYTERSTRYTYTVYMLGKKAYTTLCAELTADDDKVVTIYEEALCPWRSTDFSYNDCRKLSPRPRQDELMCEMMEVYRKTQRVFYFISGQAGVGKTTLGELFGRKLRRETKMNVVKTAVNLAAPGKGIIDHFFALTSDTILILELNEYDIALKTAIGEIKYENKEVSCYAQSKTSLNDLFDFFGRQERLVIIATTNDTTIFERPEHESFIRRFDKAVQY